MNILTYRGVIPQTAPAAAGLSLIGECLPVIKSLTFWQDNVNSPSLPNMGFALYCNGVQIFPNSGKGGASAEDNFCPVPLDIGMIVFDLDIKLPGPPYTLSIKAYNSQGTAAYISMVVASDYCEPNKVEEDNY